MRKRFNKDQAIKIIRDGQNFWKDNQGGRKNGQMKVVDFKQLRDQEKNTHLKRMSAEQDPEVDGMKRAV